jgi:hypothetical protein
MRRVALALIVVLATTMCAGGDSDDCDAVPLAPVEESAAGVRAASCAEAVELAGTTYIQWGCEPVRRGLLGPVEARNAGLYIARSIEDVPPTTALAIRGPSSSPGCRGWQFWANAELLDTNKHAVTDISQRVRVRTTGTLQ